MSGIGPGKLFASDYRIETVLSPVQPNREYVATEVDGGRRVHIVELPRSQSLAWARAAIEHPALAELLSVLTLLDSNFGVFAEVEGEPVTAKLADGIPLGAIDAVKVALRVTEGLTVLHRAGLVHGSVGPDNVMLEPDGGSRAVLTFGPVSRQPQGYRAPDRAEVDLAPEDDLWAAGALLFEMLTGAAPPEAGISAPEQLEDAGIEEDVLGGIIGQALAADPNRRSTRVASMRHPLRAWVERHEKQPESAPGSRRYAWSRAVLPSSRPPPPRTSEAPLLEFGEGRLSEPPSSGIPAARLRRSEPPQLEFGEALPSEPPPSSRDAGPPMSGPRAREVPASSAESETASSRSGRVGLIIGAAVVLGGAALLVLGGGRHHPAPRPSPQLAAKPAATHHARTTGKKPSAAPAPAPPTAAASAAPATAASVEPADTGAAAAPDESVAFCAARHLPAFSFLKTPNMDWLCTQGDPRPGAQRLHSDIVRAANGQTISPAMQLWSSLSWYGMAEFAVLRGACCPGAPALKLPAPAPTCQSLAEVLNGLAEHVAAGEDPTPQIQAFSGAVTCELKHRRQLMFWQKD